ncbi:MAG: helix-turn-helix domain-containing protein [Proteobacteria bacterium]|nr:helix-turn-helix domain-containing protein [Pseudomonadota bacterium]
MQTQQKELLDVTGTCQFLGIKKNHLRALVFHKKIPVTRIGRILKFDKEKLINWLASNTQEVEPK